MKEVKKKTAKRAAPDGTNSPEDSKQHSRNRLLKILAALTALFTLISVLGYSMLIEAPFRTTYVIDSPTNVFAGPSGRVFIIGDGMKSIFVLNANYELEEKITSSDKGFYYASRVIEDAAGNIYVADTFSTGEGTRVAAERIFKYDSKGRSPVLVYTFDYTDDPNPPLQYGRISDMLFDGDNLICAINGGTYIEVHTISLSGNGESHFVSESVETGELSDVALDPQTLLPVFVTRLGELGYFSAPGEVKLLLEQSAHEIPWRVAVDSDSIWYSELQSRTVRKVDKATQTFSTEVEGEDILYTAFTANGLLYTTDYGGCIISHNGVSRYLADVPIASAAMRSGVWLCVFLAAAHLLAMAVVLLVPMLRREHSETFRRMSLVLIVSLSVSLIVSYSIITRMVSTQNQNVMDQLNLFCDVLVDNTDFESLRKIDSTADYQSEHYNNVKIPLDRFTEMSYDSGMYYYYIVYTADAEFIYGVMDYENTMTAHHPFYAYGTEDYTDAFEGETITVSADIGAYGSWSFVLKPVADESGNIVGVMEVGVNLDHLTASNNAVIFDTVLTVAATTVVLIMTVIEALFMMSHSDRKKLSLEPLNNIAEVFPLRMLIFLTFMADCMQDAFVSVYANRLYEPIFGIPQSVGAAVPLSVEVLATAIAGTLCGNVMRRLSVKKTLLLGQFLQAFGFCVCASVENYFGLLVGKALIGVGMGFVIVTINAIAAARNTEDEVAAAFAEVNSGTLAGVAVGVGIGSIILSFGTFSTVYFFGIIILVVAAAITITRRGYTELPTEKRQTRAERKLQRKEPSRFGFLHFITDRQVVSFLALVLLPFMIALSFREYFFPLFATENGLSETDIGRLYLVCGLLVIYIGPKLTSVLVRRLGGKLTVALSGLMMCAATFTYVLVPTLGAAILGVLVLSITTSFGYASQMTFFSGIPGVKRFGEDRAMGIYTFFDNTGQTFGPVVYAFAMLAGNRIGLTIVGAAIAGLLVLFLLVSANRKAKTQTQN